MRSLNECDSAHDLMMKYMDGTLDESEAMVLRRHAGDCEACSADFEIYDFIGRELAETGLTPAPEAFTAEVMAVVRALPSPKKAATLDTMVRVSLGIFTMLFSAGFLLAMNRDAVVEYLTVMPVIGGLLTAATPVVNAFVNAFAGLSDTVAGAFLTALDFVSANRFFVAGAVFVLIGLQVLLFRKKADSK